MIDAGIVIKLLLLSIGVLGAYVVLGELDREELSQLRAVVRARWLAMHG